MWSQKKKKVALEWQMWLQCGNHINKAGVLGWDGSCALRRARGPWTLNEPPTPPLLSPSSQSLLSWRLAAETRRSRSRPDPTTEMCIAVSVQVVSHANTTPVWWMLGSNPSDAIYVQNSRVFLHRYTNGNRIEVQYAAYCCSFTMW